MFHFGDPAESARMFLEDTARKGRGPELPDAHFEDMTLEEIQVVVTWLSVAIQHAQRLGTMDDILETLVGWYDEAFIVYLSLDDSGSLKRWLFNGQFQAPLAGESKEKYQKLAEQYSES